MRNITLAALVCLGWGSGNVQAQIGGLPLPYYPYPAPIAPAMYGGPLGASAPFGGFGYTGLSYGGYGYPYGAGPFYFLPGFGATDPPRLHPTIHPAIMLPTQDEIDAKLSGDDTRGFLSVLLPDAKARVWVNGMESTQTGRERRYTTPNLSAGETMIDVRVEWDSKAGPQRRTRKVYLSGGENKTVRIY